MKNNKITRRQFIKNTVGVSAAVTVSSNLVFAGSKKPIFDAKGLPTAKLGKTGITIPKLIFGTGSRFMDGMTTDEGLELLEFALNNGLYYWDTAAIYKRNKTGEFSEERLGRILKTRRKEVFLATKVGERDGDGAKKTIEQSLKRLQTDYIDLYQVHSISDEADVEKLGKPGNVLGVLKDYQRQGIIKHIGFTGHTSSKAMKMAAVNYDFDTMLIAMNHQQKGAQQFEEQAVPAAGAKGMGVLAMKVIRPRETVNGLEPKELVRYALSLPHITSAVVGMDSIEVMKKNIETIRDFEPLPKKRMEELNMALAPFYRHERLAWMQHGYYDGMAS